MPSSLGQVWHILESELRGLPGGLAGRPRDWGGPAAALES